MSIAKERDVLYCERQYYIRKAEWTKALDVQWACGRHLAVAAYKCPLYREPGSEKGVEEREAIAKAYKGYLVADERAQEAERAAIRAREDWEDEKNGIWI